MFLNRCGASLLACSLLLGATLFAADEPLGSAVEGGESVEELVKQLDANRFSERQAASQKLSEMGARAIPALEKAAIEGDREVITRALEILKKHFESDDAGLKEAARGALETIAKSDKPAAASRAQEALNPKPAPNAAPGFGGIQIGNAQIQIQMQAGGAGRRISVRNVNGVKTTEVQEGDTKVKIEESAEGGIKLEVTQKNKEGKEEVKKYEAKDEEDLKKNHAEGYEFYKKYSQGANGIQIRALQLQPGQIQPLPAQIQPAIPFNRLQRLLPEGTTDRLKEAGKRLDDAAERLKKLAESAENAAEIRGAIEELETARKQIRELEEKFGG